MTDRGKIIEGLKDAIKRADYDGGIVRMSVEVCQIIIELLKEHEPVKPTVSIDTWICSKCGHTLESQELIDDKENPQVLIHEQYNYCPNCGREVKWDETD